MPVETKVLLIKLSNDEINFVRQYAYLIHRLFYVQLQQDQWKYYYDIDIYYLKGLRSESMGNVTSYHDLKN